MLCERMWCDVEKRGPVYRCQTCGWWTAASGICLPIRRKCKGAEETKTSLRGVGDLVEVTASATGLAILARMWSHIRRAGCACQVRKDRLNKLLPFRRKSQRREEA